jgi:predicted TIM-barrel fold metal-dependent hydrolase
MERFEKGDAWVLDGVKDPINFGMNASAGLPYDRVSSWVRYDEIRPGGHDPVARVREQTIDGVDAEILFPTPRLSYHVFAMREPDFHLALTQAYNDWLSEYCAVAPDRFGGIALLPNRGVDQAVAEVKRLAGRPGMRGFLLGAYPHGDLNPAPEDDALWAVLEEAGLPLHIHVSMVQEQPAAHTGAATASDLRYQLRIHDAPGRVLQFVFSGIFDRFPRLRLVMVEVDCGWVPYFKEQTDNRYQRLLPTGELSLALLPSEYIEQNVWWSFITDTYAIHNRHSVGVDRMMWSTDYPHLGADWPYSQRVILAAFAGVPADERARILAGNAVDLYGFGR